MVPRSGSALPSLPVPDILIATDSPAVYDDLRAVVTGPDVTVRWVRQGQHVRQEVDRQPPDLVIVDLQLGTMGGFAVCIDLELESAAGRLEPTPVLLALDRRADVFMARRSGANGWLIKPLDPIRIRRATSALLRGERWEDPSYLPTPVLVPGADT